MPTKYKKVGINMKGIDIRITIEKKPAGDLAYQVFKDGQILDSTSELFDVLFDIKDELTKLEVGL